MATEDNPARILTNIDTRMANRLLARNQRLHDFSLRTYGEDGMVIYAAGFADLQISVCLVLTGTLFLGMSKFHGPLGVVGAVFIALTLFSFGAARRRLAVTKRIRRSRDPEQG